MTLRSSVPALIIACVMAMGLVSASYGQNVHRYKIKSAIIEYKLSGMQNGTETLYFDRWGMREAKYTKSEIKMMGVEIKENKLALLLGEITYNVDLDKRRGTKMETPLVSTMKERAKKEGKDFTDLGEEMLINMGGEKIGTETILGKTCDIWEIKSVQTKAWVWKGVTLKTESNVMGQHILIEAVSIKEGANIPEDKLTLPEDVEINDMGNPLEMLNKMKRN